MTLVVQILSGSYFFSIMASKSLIELRVIMMFVVVEGHHNKRVATRLEQRRRDATIAADVESASCWIDCWNIFSSFRRRSLSLSFCSLILRLRSFLRVRSASEISSSTSVISVCAVDSQNSHTPNSVLLVVVTISYKVISPSVDPRLFFALQLYLPRSSYETLSIWRRMRAL